MTPKEKADSIFQQVYKILWHTNSDPIHCKQCALIAVDEVLDAHLFDLDERAYYQEVKQEIERL
jgi:hypothetical protein